MAWFFSAWFYCKSCELIPRFTSMENNLISKKLLEGKLFLFSTKDGGKRNEMKWNGKQGNKKITIKTIKKLTIKKQSNHTTTSPHKEIFFYSQIYHKYLISILWRFCLNQIPSSSLNFTELTLTLENFKQ